MPRLHLTVWVLPALVFCQPSPPPCKLRLGTNLGGIFDYGTEVPFVDLMKCARLWYTKAVGDYDTWDTGQASYLSYDADGYPTQIPQTSPHDSRPQYVCTFWAVTDSWEPGTYTLLWEGDGDFEASGPIRNWQRINDSTITFEFPDTRGAQLQLCITRSNPANRVRNLRLIMPGHSQTYRTQPFNPRWLTWVTKFHAVRFMDWGHTNDWGQSDPWTIDPNRTFDWSERSKPSYYTFTHSKGVPYEYMVKLMNDYDLDGWVCIPHSASPDYIRQMARFFRDNLEPDRHLVVEFSNEIWNGIFGQAQWLGLRYNCETQGGTQFWPECLVPAIQQALDIWTQEFQGQLHRITRTVGMFTSFLDASRRIAYNLRPESFDAVSPAYYFGIGEESDSILDQLGALATVSYLAQLVRRDRAQHEWVWIRQIVDSIALPLGKKVYFYEGGQHITPIPFGAPSTYDQVLLDIQRDTAMYNLYVENYEYLKSIHRGQEPWWLMNFTLVWNRSAQYGSWGLLEDLRQDTTLIPAPKLSATLRYLNACPRSTYLPASPIGQTAGCFSLTISSESTVRIPSSTSSCVSVQRVGIYDLAGRCVASFPLAEKKELSLNQLPTCAGFICLQEESGPCCCGFFSR
ncbi:MAG: hypothetical protein NZ989_02790 [Bacteroidia bacterium]|nr:hypothetical protein [Bacteroidia bacterium]MDW8057007.1 hypothetical protein [Bacteroidia bacterium]